MRLDLSDIKRKYPFLFSPLWIETKDPSLFSLLYAGKRVFGLEKVKIAHLIPETPELHAFESHGSVHKINECYAIRLNTGVALESYDPEITLAHELEHIKNGDLDRTWPFGLDKLYGNTVGELRARIAGYRSIRDRYAKHLSGKRP